MQLLLVVILCSHIHVDSIVVTTCIAKMIIATIFLLMVVTPVINSQTDTDCLEVQVSDLGNTTAISNTGLLVQSLAASAGDGTSPTIQVLEINTVCLAQGSMDGYYSFTSIVARYMTSDGTDTTVQVSYQCTASEWNINVLGSTVVTTNPTATLTTVLRNDCGACVGPGTFPSDTVNHCLGIN